VLACFATHVLSVLSHGFSCPLKPLNCNGIYAVILICRGQPPLRVMLACWSVVLVGLSHFLQFTYLLAFAVFIQSLRSFYSRLFFTHTAPPTHTSAALRSLFRFSSLHFIHSLRPALVPPTRNVQAKKCANPAASSTLPQHFVLPVSGALPPLAAARTQRTGLKLHFVTLHFAYKPCYPR
jgi:hypothetical protein